MAQQKRPNGTPVQEEDCLLTSRDVAYMLGIGAGVLARLVSSGEFLAPISLGNAQRWRYGDVKRYVRLLAVASAPKKTMTVFGPAEDQPWYMQKIHGQLQEYDLGAIRPCVYFLLQGTEVVYVGQSKCLPSRVEQHRRGDAQNGPKVFDKVVFFPVEESQLNFVEKFYIRQLKPFYNVASNDRSR